MLEDDVIYYRRRADVELGQARQASCPEVARVHADLANAYLERIAAAPPGRPDRHA